MNDVDIVELFFSRDERAIHEVISKYGTYCRSIAYNILHDEENAEEVMNDTWFGAWNSIPPHNPENLSTYLGKITRNISLTKWRDQHAAKRFADTVSLVSEELEECLPSGMTIEKKLEEAELRNTMNRFIEELPEIEQRVFVCRYFYFDSILEIAKRFQFSESKVKSMLHRNRKKLKKVLDREEVWI